MPLPTDLSLFSNWTEARIVVGTKREQMRWIVFAGLLSGGSDLLLWILPTNVLQHPIVSLNALGLLLLPIPQEMQHPRFRGLGSLLTVWGEKT